MLLAQSEVRPHCLLLVLANRTGKGQVCLGARKGVGLRLEDAGWKSGILAQRVQVLGSRAGLTLREALLR